MSQVTLTAHVTEGEYLGLQRLHQLLLRAQSGVSPSELEEYCALRDNLRDSALMVLAMATPAATLQEVANG